MARGLFITFEGGEGSGKTRVVSEITRAFGLEGIPAISTREPGGSLLGEAIRQWLLYNTGSGTIPICARAELFLFLAARVQHAEELILPALTEGKIVLCDRFNDSTIAYQGGGRGIGEETTAQLCAIACSGLQPDITFLLDVDPAIGLRRRMKALKGDLDRIERENILFHEKIRSSFLSIAKQNPSRVCIVDASQHLRVVCDQVYDAIKKRLLCLSKSS